MDKGFVFFNDSRIPFVIENYRMELFTDEPIIQDFCKEYNFKKKYTLRGCCFDFTHTGRNAIFLVDRSIGRTCYLRCYIVYMSGIEEKYDTIGLQSPFLDDVFRYQYNYMDLVRQGVNLSLEPKEVYKIPFSMREKQYELSYYIGYDNKIGLFEDYEKKGEIKVALHSFSIQECLDISVVLYRLAMFMISCANVPFKRISLYHSGKKIGWFYCPLVNRDAASGSFILFYGFDVMKYIPRILKNIALDSGNKITRSLPLGHLSDYELKFTPQRFLGQIMSFEYLFDKIEPQKAKDKRFSLKNELTFAFNLFPELSSEIGENVDDVSEEIKELRRNITHGYTYYYDFKLNTRAEFFIFLLDKLIKKMSLKWVGFSEDDIKDYHIL